MSSPTPRIAIWAALAGLPVINRVPEKICYAALVCNDDGGNEKSTSSSVV